MNFRFEAQRRYFPQNLQPQAINQLIYGKEIEKMGSNGQKSLMTVFFINEDIPIYLQYIKNDKLHRIDIRKIDYITKEIQDKKKYQIDTSLFLLSRKKQLFLKFKDKQERDLWWQGLVYFIENCSLNEQQILSKTLFMNADNDGDKILNSQETNKLFERIQILSSKGDAQKFAKNLLNEQGHIYPAQFDQIIDFLMKKDELLSLFKNYSKDQEVSEQEFKQFMEQEQKEQNLNLMQFKIPKNFCQFSNYLFSDQNSIFNPERNTIKEMNEPLSQYYINSSHNTYLDQGQLVGDSSVAAYIKALLRGCRCLELDCWDGDDQVPIIYHGYTMTSKILFEDAIIAISKFAFITSQYPLILSLELHCSYQQQEYLGEIMMKYFKDFLFIIGDQIELPSPEQLKRKILIKSSGTLQEAAQLLRGKQINSTPLSPKSNARCEQIFVDEEPDPTNIPMTVKKQRLNNSKLKNLIYNKAITNPFVRSEVQFEFQVPSDQVEMVMTTTLINIKHHPKFIACISLFNTDFKFEENRPIWNISSLSEDKIEKMQKTKLKEICRFLNTYLVRIYPAGTRFDSSNYDPYTAYMLGAQIVALNFQTNDISMLINQSRFMENNQCGYVLKPRYLREQLCLPNEFKQTQIDIKIRLISGSCLIPKNFTSSINPFVEIYLRGNPIDENHNLPVKTKTINQNAINPLFNELIQFQIADIEQALIVFQVYDQQKEPKLFAQYAIPLLCIREGYRAVPLRDTDLEYIDNAYLLVHCIK